MTFEWIPSKDHDGGELAKANGRIVGWVAWDRHANKWACAFDGRIGVQYTVFYNEAKQMVEDYVLHGPEHRN